MGGNAVPNVTRIHQENVKATLEALYQRLLPLIGIAQKDTGVLGSAGKKLPGGTSGDIDLALDYDKIRGDYSKGNLLEYLADCSEQLGCATRIFPGLNQVSISWPIENTDGKQEGQFVQVDLMPVEDLNFVSWGSFSPYEKDSPYKGAVRQNFLVQIAKWVYYKPIEEENGQVVTWQRGLFNPLHGLSKAIQTLRSPKTGKVSKTKTMKSSQLVSSNPDEIAALLFGKGTKAKDIQTIDDIWKHFLSDSFPYPERRKRIVKDIVADYEKRGFDYPSYIKEYLTQGQLNLTESAELSTPRKSMLKIHQMNPKQLVNFINLIKQHIGQINVSRNKIDLSQLNVTEKVDGMAIRFAVNKGKLYIESSHSGLTDHHQIPMFQDILDYLNEHFKSKLVKIAKEYKTWYKVIGEVLYLEDAQNIDPDNSVTFVATKYNQEKLGKFATMVIFDVQTIKKDELQPMEEGLKQVIMSDIADISNSNFKFYTAETFAWKKSLPIRFDYNTLELRKVFQEPSILLDKANKDYFIQLRTVLANAFSEAVSRHGSVIGLPGTEVEGIVFAVGEDKYGATNFNWSEVKHKIFRYQDAADHLQKQFFQTVFGYQMRKKILQCLDDPEAYLKYAIPYRQELPKFKKEYQQLVRGFLSSKGIPRRVFTQQQFFMLKDWDIIRSLKSDLQDLRRLVSPRTNEQSDS